MDDKWLTIPEYSTYRKKSVSTIRRYIKSNQVQSRLENGKYFIFVSDENYQNKKKSEEKNEMKLRFRVIELEAKVRQLEEENNDLKMLIQIYEQNKIEVNLPELPNEN